MIVNKREPLLLLVGDILFLYVALWTALAVRYLSWPALDSLYAHIVPFSVLFVAWIVSFYIAGLYEKHTMFLRNRLPSTILHTQIANSFLAVLFFYLVPFFGIAPKTVLFIYIIISFGLIALWRLILFPKFFFSKKKYAAILIGSGEELKALKHEVNENNRYGFTFVRTIDVRDLGTIDFKTEVLDVAYQEGVSLFVVDMKDPAVIPIVPQLYNLIFSGVRFIDKHKVYESIFDRIPLSIIGYSWFIENISSKSHIIYDSFKRLTDVAVALVLGLFSLALYPFIAFAIWLEDRGPVIIVQERVGQGSRRFNLIKFRSMTRNENRGGWVGETDNRVTRVGGWLRKTRLDELPQLWNVLRGDMSLIGPRPDIIGNFELLAREVPYYTIRNVVKPGLSGWAQTHQDVVPHSIEETKERLAYDLYYIKNRSFILDIKIALQTIKTLLSRVGR